MSLISYAEYAEGKEKNGPLNPYVHITDEWCQGGSARACAIMFKKIWVYKTIQCTIPKQRSVDMHAFYTDYNEMYDKCTRSKNVYKCSFQPAQVTIS